MAKHLKKLKPTGLVFILWEDSQSPSENGWTSWRDVPLGPIAIKSVGYIINEDESSITLASSLPENSKDSESISGVITIPTSAIIERQDLVRVGIDYGEEDMTVFHQVEENVSYMKKGPDVYFDETMAKIHKDDLEKLHQPEVFPPLRDIRIGGNAEQDRANDKSLSADEELIRPVAFTESDGGRWFFLKEGENHPCWAKVLLWSDGFCFDKIAHERGGSCRRFFPAPMVQDVINRSSRHPVMGGVSDEGFDGDKKAKAIEELVQVIDGEARD